MDKNFITNTYAGIGTWRPYTICRHSLYPNNNIGGLHCITMQCRVQKGIIGPWHVAAATTVTRTTPWCPLKRYGWNYWFFVMLTSWRRFYLRYVLFASLQQKKLTISRQVVLISIWRVTVKHHIFTTFNHSYFIDLLNRVKHNIQEKNELYSTSFTQPITA